jgi:quinol monooxygenase YgiN
MALRKKGADAMALQAIVELQAKPGQRAVLKSLLESIAATLGPGQTGFLGNTRYEVLDTPDILVEIAEWESAKAQATAMQQAMVVTLVIRNARYDVLQRPLIVFCSS